MRFKRNESILNRVKEIEQQTLESDRQSAISAVERLLAEEKERQQIQQVVDVIADNSFRERFHRKPKIVGRAPFEDVYQTISCPVYTYEYAELQFIPEKYLVHHIKYPWGKFVYGALESALQVMRGYPLMKKSRILHNFGPLGSECEFHAVKECSGCQQYAPVAPADYQVREGFTIVSTGANFLGGMGYINIESLDDLARSYQYLNEAASGLALDCGKLAVWDFDSRSASTFLMCNNLRQAIDEHNSRYRNPQGESLQEQHERESKAPSLPSHVLRRILRKKKHAD